MIRDNIKKIIATMAVVIIGILAGAGITINLNNHDGELNAEVIVNYSDEQVPAIIEGDQGELVETTEIDGEEIPTVEEIDGGGSFEDVDTGVSSEDGTYYELGAIESVDTSSTEAFKNSVIGRCIIANNYYGAQCVSLARAFWWGYAGFDVSTCGTGLARGMMNCWEQNAGNRFETIWDVANIQAGTWIVMDGSYTGHVCMALGPAVNGYVACLGENQGGASCGSSVGGSAANVINLSVKNFIGGYTPVDYIEPELEPEPTPEDNTCKVWNVQAGDTMGKIMKECIGEVKWGAAMNEYTSHWHSTEYVLYQNVYDGWTSSNGVGLFAGDTIEYREE